MGIRTAAEVLSKTPDEVVNRFVDFANAGLADGEAIASILDIAIDPTAEVLLDDSDFDASKVTLTLSGGVEGKVYHITVQVTTTANQTPIICCVLKVLPAC